jgi:prepilin-type N-terminal cleavage/methylation domain-containing protein
MSQQQASARNNGFTLVEMLTVIAVIVILTGLVIGISSSVQYKAAKSQAQGVIASLSAACEAYKADNGGYPRTEAETDLLDPRTDGVPSIYPRSCQILYMALSGDLDRNSVTDKDLPRYFDFRPELINANRANGRIDTAAGSVRFIQDPWGNSYGYSTARMRDEEDYLQTVRTARQDGKKQPDRPVKVRGYNTSFDLWSTGNCASSQADTAGTGLRDSPRWVKNW